jgi:hypothetical protein
LGAKGLVVVVGAGGFVSRCSGTLVPDVIFEDAFMEPMR